MSALRFTLALSVVCASFVCNSEGKSYTRPICDFHDTTSCLSFDADPDPEPFTVLDKLGRKAIAPNQGSVPTPPPIPGQDDPLLDIVAKGVDIPPEDKGIFHLPTRKLERYFPNMDIGRSKSDYDGTDLEVIEWPGIESDKRPGSAVNYVVRLEKKLKKRFIPLSFEGDQSLFKHYACNRRLGTHIRVMGFRPNDPTDPRYQEYNPFYFTFGPRSFHRGFAQPLYAPIDQLNKLAEGHVDQECQPISSEKPDPQNKLNHILSFEFSTSTLIIGLHCGILVIKPIDAPTNYIEAAKRNPDPNADFEAGIIETMVNVGTKFKAQSQKFIGRINRISSNVCCAGICKDMQPIAAAYSYSFHNTEVSLKRIYVSFDDGNSWDQKLIAPSDVTFLKLIASMYDKLKLTMPEFISRRTVKAKSQKRWGKDTDHVVDLIMGGKPKDEAPQLNHTITCAEVVSIQVVFEEHAVIALCRTDLGDPLKRKHPQGIQLNLNYAIFELQISKSSPLIQAVVKSQRRLACTIKDTDLEQNVPFPQEPEIVVGRRSSNVIVLGCESVLYHSINGGYTFWNAVFYVSTDEGAYERRYQLAGFSYPLVVFDFDSVSVTFTFGDYYAVGFISHTEEFRVIVGKVTETHGRVENKGVCSTVMDRCTACNNSALEPPACELVKTKCLEGSKDPECEPYIETFIPFNTNRKFIPYYSNSGEIRFSVSVMHFLLEKTNPNANKYINRKAVRLIDVPIKLTDAMRPFFEENKAVIDKEKGFSKCHTYGYSVDVREQHLDLSETGVFTVTVDDTNQDLSLGIFSSLPQLLKIDVTQNYTSGSGSLSDSRHHVWKVSVSPIGVPKNDMRLFEDSFFGSSYAVYEYKASHLVLTTSPAYRCHTQPKGSILLNLGCSDKKLVAHEDYDRPQCKKFFGYWDKTSNSYMTYNFTLEKGKYDEELLEYWRDKDPSLFNKVGDDWVVEYDYKTFGCPIQPYRLEDFEPDLRVLSLKENSNVSDTMAGTPLRNQYILIEIFGQTGFTYSKKVKDAGCKRPPLNLKTLLLEWKNRRKVVTEAFKNYYAFHPRAVHNPENIWPKSVHYSCQTAVEGDAHEVSDLKIPFDDPYEVMQRGSGNTIVWDRKTRKDVYFFLAIDVDLNTDTYCDYITYFAVTLNAEARSPPLHSILRFLLVFLFLVLILILGFYFYRNYIQKSFREVALMATLERGAWEILLRYEKYIHEVELHGNDGVEQKDRRRNTQRKDLKSMTKIDSKKVGSSPKPRVGERYSKMFSQKFK